MQMHELPNLSTLPAPVLLGDPDGVLERAAWSLLRCDVVAAARMALRIENKFRRDAWLRGFRPATLEAAQSEVLELA